MTIMTLKGVMSARKEAAIQFLQYAAAGQANHVGRQHLAPGFRHHNPYFRGDADSLLTAMDENAAQHPHKTLTVQRVLEDHDLVAVHSRVDHGPGLPSAGVVHIFRFDGDRIAELWDLGQEVPPDSPNTHGMF